MTSSDGDLGDLVEEVLGAGRARQAVAGELTRRDGGTVPVEFTISPIRTRDGTAGVVIVMEDVTERRQLGWG